MKIKYYGHSAWGITAEDGTRIITDPYQSGGFGGALKYAPVKDAFDVALISHEHADHNYADSLGGKPEVFRGPGWPPSTTRAGAVSVGKTPSSFLA
jgi:L-ascorbate metabolism protein UlaG (beta-lactamase superfamily)